MSDVRRPFVSWAAAIAGVIASASTARAEGPPPAAPRVVTLREALGLARAQQPQIQAAKARLAAAKADTAIPGSQWLPTIGVAAQILMGTANNTTTSYISARPVDIPRIGGTKANEVSWKPYPSTLVGAGLTQEIFDFGRIAAQRAVFEAGVEVEKQGAATVDLDVDYQVEAAYFAVQAARSVVTAAEGAYARAEAHRNLAKAGVESGMRPPIELTRAEADLMRFDAGRVRARGGLTVAQSVLAAAVGATDPALDAAEAAESTAAATPSLDAAIRGAEARDPAILAALARLRQQQAVTRAIKAEMRPDLSLTATLTSRAGGADPSSGDPAPGRGWAPSIPNWDVGAVFTWKLFDGTVIARADASRAREQVRRAELDDIRQQRLTGIQKAYIEADAANAALPALERARDAANANYAQVEARYKSGLATGVELADAEALKTEAEIQLALGRFEVARSRAALDRAIAELSWQKR